MSDSHDTEERVDEFGEAIVLSFLHDDAIPDHEQQASIADIVETLRGHTVRAEFPRIAKYEVNLIAGGSSSELVNELAKRDEFAGGRHSYLEIVQKAHVKHNIHEGTAGSGLQAEIIRSQVLEFFREQVGAILLAACIARPASFRVSDATVATRLGLTALPELRSRLPRDCRILSERYKWPQLVTLSTARTLDWLTKLEGTASAYGRGPIGRAVAAVSYAASPSHQNESRILWPLIGLEAIYGRGTDGLQRQILEKSETFLGPRKEHKREFKKIYSERSSFVHGETDIPFSYSRESTGSSDLTKRHEDIASLALAVLVATLQRLAYEDRTDLEFGYRRLDPE